MNMHLRSLWSIPVLGTLLVGCGDPNPSSPDDDGDTRGDTSSDEGPSGDGRPDTASTPDATAGPTATASTSAGTTTAANDDSDDADSTATDDGSGDSTGDPPGQSGVAPFAPRQIIYDGPATAVDWGDFDGDGLEDLFVVEGGRHAGGSQILAWFQAPDWSRHDLGAPIGPFTGDCEAVDVDGDGDVDIVTSRDQHSGSTDNADVVWFENDGAGGTWTMHFIEDDVPDCFHIGDLKVGDVDGDGRVDVVIRHLATRRFVVYFQDGPDAWAIHRMGAPHREGLYVADLDDDGRDDIIGNGFVRFAGADARGGDFEEVVIDPAYAAANQSGLNNSVKAATGDFSGDGRDDLLFSVAEGNAVYLAWFERPANPRADPWPRTMIEDPIRNQHQAEIYDIDRDGDLDVIGGFSFGDSGVVWWENSDGAGTGWIRHTIDDSGGCYSCEAADFDHDGDIDFAGPRSYTERVELYENVLFN